MNMDHCREAEGFLRKDVNVPKRPDPHVDKEYADGTGKWYKFWKRTIVTNVWNK